MKILIEGVEQTPSWGTLQEVIRTSFFGKEGKLTKIDRVDGQANYRARGAYKLTFQKSVLGVQEEVQIDLEVR